MQRHTIVEILSDVQSQKIPEGIAIKLENSLLANWKRPKHPIFEKNIKSSQKPKTLKVKGIPFDNKNFFKG